MYLVFESLWTIPPNSSSWSLPAYQSNHATYHLNDVFTCLRYSITSQTCWPSSNEKVFPVPYSPQLFPPTFDAFLHSLSLPHLTFWCRKWFKRRALFHCCPPTLPSTFQPLWKLMWAEEKGWRCKAFSQAKHEPLSYCGIHSLDSNFVYLLIIFSRCYISMCLLV